MPFDDFLRALRTLALALTLVAVLPLAVACSPADDAEPAVDMPTESAAEMPPADVAGEATEAAPAAMPTDAPEAAPPGADPATSPMVKLNLNTATEEEFLTIPGVGEQMVDEFNEYRPYTSIAQFRREIGKYVDEAQVAEYENFVFVPIDPNNADADTLQQIPGVDAAVAESLVAGRPYADRSAFVAAVESLAGAGAGAAAELYTAP